MARALLTAGLVAATLLMGGAGMVHTVAGPRAGIEAFNAALADATRHMDNAATLALWEDDGISLLPATPPIVGKSAIAKFMDAVMAGLPGARMGSFDLRCDGIEAHGDWASEWCGEHQHVVFADGRAPFDGKGRLLLVLHRGVDGRWLIRREMWNAA